MNEAVIELSGVTRTYGKKLVALNNLDFKLTEGTCYGLIGRNGAGKSTMLRIIMGMLRVDSGSVRIFNKDPWLEPELVKADMGYMAEDQQLPNVLKPQDLFRLYADIYKTWDRDFEKELIKKLELPIDRRIIKMSKGQQRQVALICAVAHRPKLLVLDEPAGGLDPVVRREFLDAVIELLNREGTTVLFSSHHLQELERVADCIGILHKGELLLEEDLATLQEGSCRVLVASTDHIDPTTIPGCVHSVDRGDNYSLTLLCQEEEARARIKKYLGKEVLQSQSMSLEDLFVNLVSVRDASSIGVQ